MKNKLTLNLSMKKSIYVSGALLAGIVICMSVFFGLREHKERELQGKSNFTPEKNGIASTSLTAPRGNPEEDLLTLDERIVQRSINNFTSLHSENEFATPKRQKKLEIMNSPEYLEYIKNAREKGWGFRHSVEFWESHGFPLDREMFKDTFRKEFPTGEPDDYEPEMRLKMAKLLLSQEPVDLTSPGEAASQRQQAFLKFIREDGRNIGWLSGQFGIDQDAALLEGWEEGAQSNPAFIWMTDVQRNAASIVTNAEATGAPGTDANTSASSWDLSSVMESPSESSDTTTEESQSIFPPGPDGLALPAISKPETDTTVAPGLANVPKTPTELPTVEGLEVSLKEQFSSERFERAMDTLEQYGPEEGLRRLRENDPEVAKQVERHHSGERKETSQ